MDMGPVSLLCAGITNTGKGSAETERIVSDARHSEACRDALKQCAAMERTLPGFCHAVFRLLYQKQFFSGSSRMNFIQDPVRLKRNFH